MTMPAGTICLWSGAIVDIPAGWILCNGVGGSPDLRNRFLVGAGTSYNPDDSGGNVNHNHAFTGDGHNHDIGSGLDMLADVGYNNFTTTDSASGTTDNGSSLPPYYSLAFIMKT